MKDCQTFTQSTMHLLLVAVGTAAISCGASLTTVRSYEAERNVAQLVKLHDDLDTPDNVQSAAEYALRRLGEPAVDELTRDLENTEDDTAGLAAHVLGQMGNPRATAPLLKALVRSEGRDPGAMRFKRVFVTDALLRIGDPVAIEPLRKLGLNTEADTLERSKACRASPECKSKGQCMAAGPIADAACVNSSDADCRASEACSKQGHCFLEPPGTKCVPDICSEKQWRGCKD
jgi:HEAT repeat protein